jgi:signal transduction histidine kinase
MSSLRRALIAIGIAGFAAGVGIAVLTLNSDHLDLRGAAAAVGLLLGWSFIGTGLYAWDRRPENGIGALMVAFGFAWFLSALVTANSELVFTIGLFINNLFFAVMLHLLLAFPSGRLETRNERFLAWASYFVAVPLGLPVMLFADTTNDEVCGSGCPENLLMVQDSFTTTEILTLVQIVPALFLFAAVGRVCVRRWRAAEGVERTALTPMIWAGLVMLAVAGVQIAAGAANQDGVELYFFFACLLAMAAVPYGFLVGLLRSRTAGLELENVRLDAELQDRIEELRASRARIVQASDTARRRLERDLHDGAQQRLVALALDLKLARGKLDSDPAAAAELLDASIEELAEATSELRELARGIHPALLTDRGLGPALEAIASRAPIPVEVAPVPDLRLPGPVESAAYFVVAEALTNVSKYASASHAEVVVTRSNGKVVVEVRDDGVGGADPAAGSGLSGLADRVAALDGMLDVESPRGGGTVVRAEVPCE